MESLPKAFVPRAVALLLSIATVAGQTPTPRPPPTPEQQAEAAKRREAELKAPRPIAAVDSVWTEELTWMEVRDAIQAGKTTGLILSKTLEMAKKIVELRTRLTVDAINRAMGQ